MSQGIIIDLAIIRIRVNSCPNSAALRLAALHDVEDPGERVEIPVPEGVREQLRALGYLSDE